MASKPYFDLGKGAWYCKVKSGKKWAKKRLGKHPTAYTADRPPKKPPQFVIDRRNEFAEAEYREARGLSPAASKEKPLAGYIADYLEAYPVGHDPGSVQYLKTRCRQFLEWAEKQGLDTIQSVGRSACRDFLEYRARSGISHNTLRTEKGYLAGIWRRAAEDGLVAANPWSKIKPPGKAADADWTFWSGDEIRQIAAACNKPWHSDFVLILANTGLRIAAGLSMRWNWLDWDKGMICVPPASDKAGKGYKVPMTATARDILTRRFAEGTGDLVFPGRYGDEAPATTTAARAIMAAIKKAGVKRGTPHDLRHTFGRWLVSQNVPINIVQAALGHASLAMTQKYTKARSEEGIDHLESLNLGAGPITPPTPPS